MAAHQPQSILRYIRLACSPPWPSLPPSSVWHVTLLSSAPGPRLSAIPLHTLYTLLEPVTVPAHHPRSTFINWGLTYTCRPLAVFEPETEYQCELIFELARREGKTVRATGVGHSPSDLACTSGYMLRTEKLNKIIEVGSFLLIWPFAPFRGHRHRSSLRGDRRVAIRVPSLRSLHPSGTTPPSMSLLQFVRAHRCSPHIRRSMPRSSILLPRAVSPLMPSTPPSTPMASP